MSELKVYEDMNLYNYKIIWNWILEVSEYISGEKVQRQWGKSKQSWLIEINRVINEENFIKKNVNVEYKNNTVYVDDYEIAVLNNDKDGFIKTDLWDSMEMY